MFQDHPDHLDLLVHKELLVAKDLMVLGEQRETRVGRVCLVYRACLAQGVNQENLGHQDSLDVKELGENMVSAELLVHKAKTAGLGHQDLQGQGDHEEMMVILDHLDHLDLQDHQACPVLPQPGEETGVRPTPSPKDQTHSMVTKQLNHQEYLIT